VSRSKAFVYYKKSVLSQMMVAVTVAQIYCGNNPEPLPLTTQISAIQPPPILVPGKTGINIYGPVFGSTPTRPVIFKYDTSALTFAAIYIFLTQPTASNGYITDISSCIGGASNMASHPWNNYTISLDITSSGFYLCQLGNNLNVLSTSNKLFYDAAHFTPGSTYYWVVLGYNSNYQLTHSSPLYEFIAP